MIPKKIHYCWFSNDPIPKVIQHCLDSWNAELAGYEIVLWNLQNFEADCVFAEKAIAENKWAFLTDYARFKIIHEEGGIFLDSDVLMVKSFDDLLEYNSFWGQADNGLVEPVVFGAEKGNELVKECLACYKTYNLSDGFIEVPKVIAPIFIQHGVELSACGVQYAEHATVFPFDYFCPMPFEKADSKDPLSFKTNNTYAIHLWNAAWFDPFRFFWNGRHKAGWRAVYSVLRNNPNQGWSFYRNVAYHLKCTIFGYPK